MLDVHHRLILKGKRFILRYSTSKKIISAFLFPALSVLIAFIIIGCFPFGENMNLTMDLYHQYCPFLVTFRNKLLSGDSLFYSWNDGLGQEYYATYANYAASPLNLFSLFFTAKTMPVFIEFITCIRAGLASVFMFLFLSANDNDKTDTLTVAFSSSYALCGWFISFFWNIMWCDAVVLLPLITLGLRKLLIDRKCGLYIFALAAAIFSNYYTGYFLCVFLVLFAPAYFFCLFSRHEPIGNIRRLCFSSFIGAAARFTYSSVLAAGLSAFLTVPTYLILKHCSAIGDHLVIDYTLQNTPFDLAGRLMVSANPNIRGGMANIYSGIVIALLVPLFFMLPSRSGIKLKHKISFGFLILIMYLSFSNRTLNFIWHGMHFPNQIPYRESFIFSFLLVFIAFMTVRRIRVLGPKCILGMVISVILFLILFERFGSGNEGYSQIEITVLFLMIQGAVLYVLSDAKQNDLLCKIILAVTMMFELLVASIISIGLVFDHEGLPTYAPYGMNYAQVASYTERVEGSEGHMVFERSELFPNNVFNIQSLYNVKGISIFSSTARENFVKYIRNFGFYNNGVNGLRSAGLTRVTATLFNVRNLVEVYKTESVPNLFEKEYADDMITSWSNTDALSIGFMTDPAIIDYAPDYDNEIDVFAKTNVWIEKMGACDVYKPVSLILNDTSGYSASYSFNCGFIELNSSGGLSSDEYSFSVSIDNAEIGSDLYLYVNSNKDGTVTVNCGENSRRFVIRDSQIITAGVFDGTPVEIYVEYFDNPGSSLSVYGYQLDKEGYDKMLETLSDEQLEVTFYDSDSLNGHINVKEDGILFLTIPYAEGWSATIDGKEGDIVPIQDALMGIMLTEGSHDIELKYTLVGFKEGIIISAISLILLLSSFYVSSNKSFVAHCNPSNTGNC